MQSPVDGGLRQVASDGPRLIIDGLWEFWQHKRGLHRPGLGIGGADDTYAWDADLRLLTNSDADRGLNVYPTADGQVVLYSGIQRPGGLSGAILIAHPDAHAPRWWSGYLHMFLSSIHVKVGDHVTPARPIGHVGSTGAGSVHLHVVVYTGENIPFGLVSTDAVISERPGSEPSSDTSPPMSIVPTGAGQ